MITTNNLDEILKTKKSIYEFIDENSNELVALNFTELLEMLLHKKNKLKSYITHNTLIPERYVYEIFSGAKVPGRDRIIQIALALQLTENETNHLLNAGNAGRLYVKNKRDSIIIFCLNNNKSVMECNDYLDDYSLSILD